jgi:hypothetical protein
MLDIVRDGPFGGCTKTQLDAARREFTSQAATGFTQQPLSGASINGQSFQFMAPNQQEYTRAEYWEHLKGAYWQLGITDYGAPARSTARGRLG